MDFTKPSLVHREFTPHSNLQNVSKRISVQRIVTSLLLISIICQLPFVGLAPQNAQLTILMNLLFSVLVFSTVIYLSKHNTFILARFLLIVTFVAFIACSSWLWKSDYHTHWFLLLGIVIVTYLFSVSERIGLYSSYLAFAVVFLGFEFYFLNQSTNIVWTASTNYTSGFKAFTNAVFMVLACIAVALNIRSFMDSHWRSIQTRSSDLQSILDRVFPSTFVPTGNKLTSQTQRFYDVSILFIDMSSYSEYATTHPLDKHVELLHQAYTLFDQILSEHGVVRVKTNGDQYIAAIGIPFTEAEIVNGRYDQLSLPQKSKQLCFAAASIHKEFANVCREFEFKSHLKMGIATGDVTAGFIGKLRPSFDLWGAPMIIASRLEQLCPLDNILLCPKTYNLIQGSGIKAEFHGERHLKGLKHLCVYRLLF